MTIECYLSNCPYHDTLLGIDPGPFCSKSECDGLWAMHKEIGRLKTEMNRLRAGKSSLWKELERCRLLLYCPHPVTLCIDCPEEACKANHQDTDKLQAERDRLKEAEEVAQKGLVAVQRLIDESDGVYGLHLNGDLAWWSELLAGGWMEEWLMDFSAAIERQEESKL